MNATGTLHDRGQSLWLDNITRELLESGTLARYINEDAVTGLTSNPTIFDHAIKNSSRYDAAIRQKVKEGKSGEDLFFELALEDLTRAADLFRPIWDRRRGGEGPGAGSAAQSARHRDRQADVQGVSRPSRLSALAARLQRRRPPATPALGQHGYEGSGRVRHPLYTGARGPVHGQHHA